MFQRLRSQYPHISEEAAEKAWAAVHRMLFGDLDAGRCSMATVRDSRFRCLFEVLALPTGTQMQALSDRFCWRYLMSLRLYTDVATLPLFSRYHVGIVTNGAADAGPDSQLAKVRHLGLTEQIRSLAISDAVGSRKPNLEIFRVACEQAGVAPHEALFIGDTLENDSAGANRAGMTSVLINRKPMAPIPMTADERPDHTFSTLYDVLHRFGHDPHT